VNFFEAWEMGHNKAHAQNGCNLSHNKYPVCRTCNQDCCDYDLSAYTKDVFKRKLPTAQITESVAKAIIGSMRSKVMKQVE
jgi:hypothetical protein